MTLHKPEVALRLAAALLAALTLGAEAQQPRQPPHLHQLHQPAPSGLHAPGHAFALAAAPSFKPRPFECADGLTTFEIATGFIYKSPAEEPALTMPSTLQLTECLDMCLRNSSCAALNFEVGLCVLLVSSAGLRPNSLHASQFPVFTIYAEKKCLRPGK